MSLVLQGISPQISFRNSGGGGSVSGEGTPPRIPKWNDVNELTDGSITDNTTHIAVDGYIQCGGTASGQSSIASGMVINQSGGSLSQDDFRVESVSKTYMLHVDASLNGVGIGQSAGVASLSIGNTGQDLLNIYDTQSDRAMNISNGSWVDDDLIIRIGDVDTANHSNIFTIGPHHFHFAGGDIAIGVPTALANLHVGGNIRIDAINAGVDNTVLISVDGEIRSDEIDSRVWGSSLVDGSGATSRVAFWTGGDTLSYNNHLCWDMFNDRLGIGTTSPQELLHVSGSGTARLEIESSSGDAVNKVTTANSSFGLLGQGSVNKFSLYDYNASAYRLTVDSAGKVGIGTTSPSEMLEVINTTDVRIKVKSTASRSNAGLVIENDTAKWSIEAINGSTGDILQFVSGGSTSPFKIEKSTPDDVLYVSADSRIGINTDAPEATLHIIGSETSANFQRIDNTIYGGAFKVDKARGTVSTPLVLQTDDIIGVFNFRGYGGSIYRAGARFGARSASGTKSDTSMPAYLYFATTPNSTTTPVERMRVSSNGNIGVNTTSPTVKLDINSDSMRLRTSKTPASASATGAVGEVCWDSGYLYICVATNTWKRASLTTW